jgi:pyruvate kinase
LMLPGKEIKVPVLSQKDIADAKFGMSCNVDGFMLSFVQRAGDIKELQEVMKSCGQVLPVISKIESRAGLDNLPEIVKASDGILVARGDLGVELPVWELPYAQAMIIKEAHKDKKPVIVATEMLESMIFNSRPTRAEVSDVAAAVTGGADVVMLSGETAVGKFPAKAVKIMDNTLLHAEKNLDIPKKSIDRSSSHILADGVSHSAVELSKILSAKAILIYTRSGFTARIVSYFAPSVPIYVFSESGHTARLCNLYRGTFPFKLTKRPENFEYFLGESTSFLVSKGLLSKGDKVVAVNVTGKHGTYDHSNSIKVFVC